MKVMIEIRVMIYRLVHLFIWCILLCSTSNSGAQEAYKLVEGISYYSENIAETDDYIKQRCRLDVYYPTTKTNVPTVIWFHGGGLTGGNKYIPEGLKEQELIVVAVNYRLSPAVKSPAYIEDAAAAVAWVFEHIEDYNGTKENIFVSGHSAGGYLTYMLGMDANWLNVHHINLSNIRGIAPLSGHTITHFTIRKERGIGETTPLIDEMAPLYHLSKDIPPLLIVTGDREMELMARYEENAYFLRMLQHVGHKDNQLYELEGFNHVDMVDPALKLVLKFIKDKSKKREN